MEDYNLLIVAASLVIAYIIYDSIKGQLRDRNYEGLRGRAVALGIFGGLLFGLIMEGKLSKYEMSGEARKRLHSGIVLGILLSIIFGLLLLGVGYLLSDQLTSSSQTQGASSESSSISERDSFVHSCTSEAEQSLTYDQAVEYCECMHDDLADTYGQDEYLSALDTMSNEDLTAIAKQCLQ